MKHSKYNRLLKPLLKKPFFTIAEAKKHEIPRSLLAYYAKIGILERVCQGIYRSSKYETQVDFEWENLAINAATMPQGVICLISALCYHDLTDQIMREAWIAVPHKVGALKRSHVRLVRMRNLKLGKTTIKMGEFKVCIFDRERCIVDAFRYLSKEIALKSLQTYLHSKDHKPQPKKLSAYAKRLRVNLTPYILSYMT